MRGDHTGTIREVTRREPRTVVVAQHLLADHPRALVVSGYSSCRRASSRSRKIVVRLGHRVGVQFDD